MHSRTRALLAAGLVGLAAAPFVGGARPADALSGTVPATVLEQACETSPSNIVNLLSNVTVEGIAAVSSKCTINIPASASLEFVGADMRFAGPLVINGGDQTKAELTIGSRIAARAVTLNFPTPGGQVKIDDSQLASTVGATRILMGDSASVVVSTPTIFGANVDSATALTVSTGAQSYIELNGASVLAGGAAITMRGTDSVMLSQASSITTRAAGQSIAVTSTAPKASAEINFSTLSAHGNVNLAFTGTESAIKATSSQAIAGGSVTVAASNATGKGLVEWVGPQASLSGTRVVLQASATSQFGAVKLADAAATASGLATSDVIVRTGPIGNTEVLESSVSATRAVRITSTPPTGSCKQEGNVITAPIRQLCA